MLGGYGCDCCIRLRYVLPLCCLLRLSAPAVCSGCLLRLSDGAPVLRARLRGCGCFGSLGFPFLGVCVKARRGLYRVGPFAFVRQ